MAPFTNLHLFLTACWSIPCIHALALLLSFSMTIIAACFALHQSLGSIPRHSLVTLHFLGAAVTIYLSGMPQTPFQHLFVPSALTTALHTTCVLCIERTVVTVERASPLQRLRTGFRVAANIRRLSLLDFNPSKHTEPQRASFAALRCIRAASFLALHHVGAILVARLCVALHATLADFSPDRQGLVPSTSPRELFLRVAVSCQWIWSTYLALTGAHDLAAVFFVAVLRWDAPGEWPPLFGPIGRATSLRRFWGVFWHGLHIHVFDGYLTALVNISTATICRTSRAWRGRQPSPARQQPEGTAHESQTTRPRDGGPLWNTFRALWMFGISAGCHAAANWIVMRKANTAGEFRFFLANYVVCVVETVVERKLVRQWTEKHGWWTRVVGYSWVVVVMLSLSPGWQYSLIWSAVGL